MSWQSYVDDQLLATKNVAQAVICGHDGNIWAQSTGINTSPQELKAVISKFDDPGTLAASGIMVGGMKYMYLSGRPGEVIRGKKDKAGVFVCKTTQTYIFSIYVDTVPEMCAQATEKLGDYMKSVGY